MVGKTGFEPATPWSQTRCSTKLNYFPIYMARPVGVEPATFWSVVKRSIQLSYGRSFSHFLQDTYNIITFYIISQYYVVFFVKCFFFEKNRINIRFSYFYKWWFRTESNCRHEDFQSSALPTELRNHKWRSRRELNSRSSAWQADVITATLRDHMVAGDGFEPTTSGLWARRATKLLHPAI